MTRKGYQVIATALAKHVQAISNDWQEGVEMIEPLLWSICETLRDDNPRFDEEKFREWIANECRLAYSSAGN
jgi:hypothetical protein